MSTRDMPLRASRLPMQQAASVLTGTAADERLDGTAAAGTKGPDLSHIGSRLTVGAATLPNDDTALARFIAHPGSVKVGAQMPAYPHLSVDELQAVAAWLKGLR